MIYYFFNQLCAFLGSIWTWAGVADPHHAFVGGILAWFVAERILGFIATPAIKGASIVALLLIFLLTMGAFSSFSTYANAPHPAVTEGQKQRDILKDALK